MADPAQLGAELEPEELWEGLALLLGPSVEVLGRRPVGAGSFPSEIVQVRSSDGERSLFCKYGSPHPGHEAHGARGGIEREIFVYESLLPRLRLSQAGYVGCFARGSESVLVLDHIDHALKVTHVPPRIGVAAAARWLASFHGGGRRLLPLAEGHLPVHGREYHLAWFRRAREYHAEAVGELLEAAEPAVRCAVTILEASPRTIVHGEFYPLNLLYAGGKVFPVDWESAAVGAAEEDLAALLVGWQPRERNEFMRDYCTQRRRPELDGGFDLRVRAAACLDAVRWLGDRPTWAWPYWASPSVDDHRVQQFVTAVRDLEEVCGG